MASLTAAAAAFGWLLVCAAHLHASAQMPPVVRVASYDYTNTFNGAYVNNLSAAPDLAAFAVEGRELIAGIAPYLTLPDLFRGRDVLH